MAEHPLPAVQRTHEVILDRGVIELHTSARKGEAFTQMCDFLFQLELLEKERKTALKGRAKERNNILASIEAQEIEIRNAMKRLAYRHHPLGVV